MAAHGVSVVEVERSNSGWKQVLPSKYARRITAETPMLLSGPVAGHAMVKTAADPTGTRVLGTFNNCANGQTPWGTYLTCEENFNGYFGTTAAKLAAQPLNALENRYGMAAAGFGYRWHEADPRFDFMVGVDEPRTQMSSQVAPDRGLATAGHADEGNGHGVSSCSCKAVSALTHPGRSRR